MTSTNASRTDNVLELTVSVNQLDLYQTHLKNIVTILEHYVSKNPLMNKKDAAYIKETITKALYVKLIFDELKNTYEDEIPEELDFSDQMMTVIDNSVIETPKSAGLEDISIVKCVNINITLTNIVRNYYTGANKKPFWKFW